MKRITVRHIWLRRRVIPITHALNHSRSTAHALYLFAHTALRSVMKSLSIRVSPADVEDLGRKVTCLQPSPSHCALCLSTHPPQPRLSASLYGQLCKTARLENCLDFFQFEHYQSCVLAESDLWASKTTNISHCKSYTDNNNDVIQF